MIYRAGMWLVVISVLAHYWVLATRFWMRPVSKDLCSFTGRTTWRSGCCSGFSWFWCPKYGRSCGGALWTAFLNSGWVLEMLQGSLVELWFTCLRSRNPWELVTESETFRTGVCSWSDCDGDECWDNDKECSSCSDSTSHTFGFVVRLRFGCNVSINMMKVRLFEHNL